MFLKFTVAKLLKTTYWKYTENSNIQKNIKKILHLVQEFYFEINVKFKQKSWFHWRLWMLTSPKNGWFNLPLSKTYWYKKISKKLNFMYHMFIAGINLLSPGEICMMAHFHTFATKMFKKNNTKNNNNKKINKKRKKFPKMYCQNTCRDRNKCQFSLFPL